jgi:tRNA(Ile)-lysidine synthase
MYYGGVQGLPQTVLAYILKHGLLRAGDQVGVAVSGGADSVALARLLLELRAQIGIVLAVVHFNHRLRGSESDEDERFVAELAERYQLEFHSASANVAACASERGLSLEAAGRKLRYQYFYRLLAGKLNRIATAHTVDDQAETVLLKITRGAGSRGLAGIYPQLKIPGRRPVEDLPAFSRPGSAAIVRPLLSVERKQVREYLGVIGQRWREDPSNQDLRHARNRVRQAILPGLERDLNPAVRQALAETAEIARGEEEYWEQETESLLPSAWVAPEAGNRAGMGTRGGLRCDRLRSLPVALGRRLVRRAAESLGLDLEFRHVEEILALAERCPESEKTLALPGGWTARLSQAQVQFAEPCLSPVAPDYEYRLAVPGSIEVPQTGSRFEALLVSSGAGEGYNPDDLLDPAGLSGELRVRNWRPGDRFWPAHRKAEKKVKELLEERHLRGTERKAWPVVVNGRDLVWVRGFAVPRRLRPREGSKALWIREVRLEVA